MMTDVRMNSCYCQQNGIKITCLCCNLDFFCVCSVHIHFRKDRLATRYYVDIETQKAEVVTGIVSLSLGDESKAICNGGPRPDLDKAVNSRLGGNKRTPARFIEESMKDNINKIKLKYLTAGTSVDNEGEEKNAVTTETQVDNEGEEKNAVITETQTGPSDVIPLQVSSENDSELTDVSIVVWENKTENNGEVVNSSQLNETKKRHVEYDISHEPDGANAETYLQDKYFDDNDNSCEYQAQAGKYIKTSDKRDHIFSKKHHFKRNSTTSLNKTKVPCDVCGLMFQKRHLKRHRESHSETKQHVCDICSKAFKTKSQLYCHKLHHNKDKDWVCQHCGKSFNNGPNLRQHIKTHTRERSLTCPVCSKRFCSSYVLKDHIMRHSEDKPFSCSVCGRAFRKQQEVKRHMIKHSDTRDHPCSLCGKQFKSKSNRIKHEKIHTTKIT